MLHRLLYSAALTAAFIALPLPAGAQQITFVNSAAAVQQALDNVPDGGVVEFAAGTYSAPKGGWTIYPALGGGTRSFTVRAAAGAAVTLTGDGANRILTFTTPKPVTFERLNFRNGLSTEEYHAGAISLSRVEAKFISCVFENNAANPSITGGGAVWIDTSTVLFQGCVFNNNTSKNYAGAVSAYASQLYVRDCRFVGNRTNLPGHSSFSAAGALNANACAVRIANSRFENNQAGYVGGAIYVIGTWDKPASDLQVTDSLFTGNVAVRDAGGTRTDPTSGGAIFMEDKVTAGIYNSRFTNNTAQQGGAVGTYRSSTDIKSCVFQGNRAVGSASNGESLGGSICVLSFDMNNPSSENGTVNRPSATLAITDSLFQGQGPNAPSARQGGAIFSAGDTNAAFGMGVPQSGTQESNRTLVTLKRVVFADLATVDSAGNGTGGALTGSFTTLRADSCIIQNCSTSQNGGGFEFVYGSDATITNTTFAQNSAGQLGGAVTLFGGNLNMNACAIVDNRLTGPGGGTALVTTAQPAAGTFPAWDVTGTIQNCVISNNSGGSPTIYDGYRALAPFNRLQYSANKFFPADRTVFFQDTIGYKTVEAMNATTLLLGDRTNLTKAPVANESLAAEKSTSAIMLVPPATTSSGAPGEVVPLPAYLAFSSSAGTPVIDGVAQRTASGVIRTLASDHVLSVAGVSSTTAAPPGVALNMSTRVRVGGGDQVLISGLIAQGSAAKRVIIRGVGPSLKAPTGAPMTGALQNPALTLYDSAGQVVASNDDWQATQLGGLITARQAVEIHSTGIPPASNLEPAIVVTLKPNVPYTAVMNGVNGSGGTGLIEVYDLDTSATTRLANISTRGLVQSGDNVMIAGFFFSGGSNKLVVRGLGPSLPGIPNSLKDPVLELFDSNGSIVRSNDNWTDTQAVGLRATGLNPPNDAEAAVLVTDLAPGPYTAVLSGKNGSAGVGLVELYVF